ncbi:MAG: hypothetical protein HY812_17800 [Planctomycetes bacterium]|nr:hypothetical protein [Planctomycetota bacterium]
MNEIMAILGVALLFVVFAIAQRMNCRSTGCEKCHARNAGDCAECQASAPPPESNDATV